MMLQRKSQDFPLPCLVTSESFNRFPSFFGWKCNFGASRSGAETVETRFMWRGVVAFLVLLLSYHSKRLLWKSWSSFAINHWGTQLPQQSLQPVRCLLSTGKVTFGGVAYTIRLFKHSYAKSSMEVLMGKSFVNGKCWIVMLNHQRVHNKCR